ncbi:MAG: DEAD/DEAH box helicase [Candidatus Aminicenantes bacterium]|nr:DEAD/DEAH box helicase [Candidatus Aminicenantes bacterium]
MTATKDNMARNALAGILALEREQQGHAHVVHIPPFSGDFQDYPDELAVEVSDLFRQRGIRRLYSHQARAIRHILDGSHVVVATPTASGKTLIYNSVSLNALTEDPSAKSLYVFPTKALAQDQLAELFDLNRRLGDRLGLYTYDGDTPQSMRRSIRRQAQIVLTNPYMLHSGILPHHTKWISLFENLRFVILDELHSYTGVFGSHMANVIRRLRRIARFYGSDPIFIMSSATIANPKELAERIIESPVKAVLESGAPRGEKHLIFFNPPIVNRQLGIRKSYVSMARHITGILVRNGLQVIVFANSRLNTEVLVKYLKTDLESHFTAVGTVRGYRGGYLPKKRREIEKGLREGRIKAVVSTNALELGIDIGSLDAAVLAAYPGTIASTWQRLGRAGRRSDGAIGVLISSSSPVDQFIAGHPEYFTESSPEQGRINADNLSILIEHIKCAAFELPFSDTEAFGKEDLKEILNYLAEHQILYAREGKWFWTTEGYPADTVSLTRVTSDNFVVVDRTGPEQVIAEVDFSSALETLHPKAIYILEGVQYVVEEFDFENRKAFVRESQSDYYTDAITNTKISVLDREDETRCHPLTTAFGDVHVFSQVVGFKKLKFFTNENVGAGNLQLPQQEMHTTAFWFTISSELLEDLDIPAEDKIEAVNGLAHLMRHMASVILMCAPRDLGVAVEDNLTQTSVPRMFPRSGLLPGERFEPSVYIYDNYPNGIGFSDALYSRSKSLLEDTLSALLQCRCERGCPSCVGPPIRSDGRHKAAARFLLERLLGVGIN